MRLHNMMILSLLFSSMLSGCSWFSGEEDVVIISPLPKVNNQFQAIVLWRNAVGNGTGEYYSTLHPAWQDVRVFAADRYGLVKALDVDTGQEIWSKDLSLHVGFLFHNRPALLSGGVTTANDRVYIGSELGKVYALRAEDGSMAWQAKVAGEVLSSPVVSDGMVLVHTSNGMLQALNEFSGTIAWTVNLDVPSLTLRGQSSPTTTLGAAIIGGNNGRVSAVLINQGQLIWQQRIFQSKGATEVARLNDVRTTPVVVNGVVYASAYNGNLAALHLHSGQVIWSREIGAVTDLLVNSGYIYLVDQDDRVIVLDSQGRELWRQSELLHRHLTSPTLYNGYIVTGDLEGYLHWINIDDGRFVSQQKVDSAGLLSKPIVAGNKLIVQSKNGAIYAFTR